MNLKTLLTIALCVMAPAARPGAVVVSKDSPIGQLDADQARRVFLGHSPNLGGQSIVVLYQNDGPIRTEFETRVLGKTGTELSTYWSAMIFTGRAIAPVDVIGDAGVKVKLATNPNAIGYISDAAVDGSVKVLLKY